MRNYKINYLILLLFFQINILFSQKNFSGKVEYTVKPSESFNPMKISKDQKKRAKLIPFFMESAHFILNFTQKESLYKKKSLGIKIDNKKGKSHSSFSGIFGGGDGIYYSESNDKTTILQKNSFGDLFLVSHHFPKWELSQETKKIGKYKCFKAIRINKSYEKNNSNSKKTIVWYTPEIPVPFGPTLYNGLPGLVMEVKIGKIIFSVTKITLNSKKKIFITLPKKGIKISEEKYYRKLREFGKSIGF